jgi:hypothetical protein
MKQYAVTGNVARQVDVFSYRSPAEWLENLKIIFVYTLCFCMILEGNITMELQKWDGGMDWIDLVEDRNKRRALVNAVMNLRLP